MARIFRTLLIAAVNAIKEFLAFATDNGESQVGDNIKLNDGMATSNYDWSAYPNDTTITSSYTQTGTVEAIKEVGENTVYVTQEPQQDNKNIVINTDQISNIEVIDNTTINTIAVSTPTDGYRDVNYYAYTDNDNNTYYATDNPISKGIFNLQNANIVGTLTNDNGTYSGFSTNNYLMTDNVFNPQNQNWNIEVNLITGDNVITEQGFIGGGGAAYKVLVEVYNQHFRLMLSSNNSSFNILNSLGSYTVQPFTEYWVRISYNTITGYKLEYKTSSADIYTLDISTSDTTNIYNVSLPISLGANKYSTSGSVNLPFYGSINLINTTTTIEDDITTFGYFSDPSTLYENTGTTEFTPVALDPQPAFEINNAGLINASVSGTLTNNNGVYSGFSGSNYLFVNNTFIYNNYFKIILQIKTSNNFSIMNAILATSDGQKELYIRRDRRLTYWASGDTYGTNELNNNTTYWIAFESDNGVLKWYTDDGTHSTYNLSQVPTDFTDSFWRLENYKTDSINNRDIYIGKYDNSEYFEGSIDMNNVSFNTDGTVSYFYNSTLYITIASDKYDRNSTKDDFTREIVPATIETSANITTSNNDNVITDGSYHLFNLTVPTGMTAVIESNGISYQQSDMPLLLKKNSGVGLLIKDGNNAYYRNTWSTAKDYDLHYQQINFSYPSGATVTCKVNNVTQGDLTPYVYFGDTITWTCDNAGTITTGSYTVKYSNKDGNVQVITIS